MQTIGSHVLMADDDLVGTPDRARRGKPEGVLLLYREREINDTSVAAFVHTFLETLQRDELHIDLISEALARSGFVDAGHNCPTVQQQQRDERVALVADILMEQLCADLVLRRALIRITGDLLAKLTALPPAIPRSALPLRGCCALDGPSAPSPVSTRAGSAEVGCVLRVQPTHVD
jgi:hypothetical protein